VCDQQFGRFMNANLGEYHIPVNADIREIEVIFVDEHDEHVNPLGVKGAGETGTIASTPAVVNAVVDALSGLGVDHIDAMPMTPERVWKTAQAAKSRK